MIRDGDIAFLGKALETLEEEFEELKKAHARKDAEKFNELKKKFISTETGILGATE